jgi:septum formation inhibitor-activating ATPase MinD
MLCVKISEDSKNGQRDETLLKQDAFKIKRSPVVSLVPGIQKVVAPTNKGKPCQLNTMGIF